MINETLIDTPPQLWRTSELVDNARRYVDGDDERTPDRLFLALNTLTLVLARSGRAAQASELLDRGIQAADRLMRTDADAIRFGIECVINHADLLRYAGEPRAAIALLREVHELSSGRQPGRAELLGVDLVRGRDASPAVLGGAMFMLRLRSRISLLKTLVAVGAEAEALASARAAAEDSRGGDPPLDVALDYVAALDDDAPAAAPGSPPATAVEICQLIRLQSRTGRPLLPVEELDAAVDRVVAATEMHNPRTPILWRVAHARAADLDARVGHHVALMGDACVAAGDRRLHERALLFAGRDAGEARALFPDPRPDAGELDALTRAFAGCVDELDAPLAPAV
ncbi:hypothetical protein DZF92_13980 [Clavibacter michiganensis subsp. insidiosus]|nr:hypothetical protein [Clavibacter michiganensis]OQJ59753.1 hypothetical protein B5P21_07410 [Clavibacter michiganensis subsp. insidiosus]RII85499.1 hypothetical protein DZF92_13980 [Clavibacter michiganensis subsp. insidiosus]RMC85076.1 hypothetical protein CmiCFBP2404_09670 [Clavibacter michiganensis subsp. insidiosus]